MNTPLLKVGDRVRLKPPGIGISTAHPDIVQMVRDAGTVKVSETSGVKAAHQMIRVVDHFGAPFLMTGKIYEWWFDNQEFVLVESWPVRFIRWVKWQLRHL